MTDLHAMQLFIKEHLKGALFSCDHPRISSRGKVRDMIDQGDSIIMINTDRLSAFDHVLGTVPLKGALLCEQINFWFNQVAYIIPHHVLDRLDPQIMVVKKAEPILIEIVVRNYLTGSLLREPPQTRGEKYGLTIDPALKPYEKLEHPIITPTTKAKIGAHDEPISPHDIVAHHIVSQKLWDAIAHHALAVFAHASSVALKKGLLLVDTKYEFGLIDGKLHIIDEIHTSDSSRYFLADDYNEKFVQKQLPTLLDKEYFRQHLLSSGFKATSDFTNYTLPDDLRSEIARRYFTLTETIIGHNFCPPTMDAHARVNACLHQLIC